MTITPFRRPGTNLDRLLGGLAASALLHGAIALAVAGFGWSLDLPRLDITWLDLDNRLGAPARPAAATSTPPAKRVTPPSPSPPPRRVAPRARAPRRAEAVRPAKPAPDAGLPAPDAGAPARARTGDAGPGSERTELAALGSGDAALVLLVRAARIRGGPYEESVRRLLEIFYDHKTLLWSSGLDPVADFDALLIATPNPYRVTQTFLVVSHSLPISRVRPALERAVRHGDKGMKWRRDSASYRGEIPSPPRLAEDPRIVVMRDRLLALTDPDHLPHLCSESAAGGQRPAARDASRSPGQAEPVADTGPATGGSGTAEAPEKTEQIESPRTWVERLERMAKIGGDDANSPALLLQAVNIPRLVRLPPEVPPPLSFKLAIDAADPAAAEAEARFASPEQARAFLDALPRWRSRARSSFFLRLIGLASLLNSLDPTQRKESVHARLTLPAEQVRGLLALARGMIPQVRVPGLPDRVSPEPAPVEAKPDARNAAPDGGGSGTAIDAAPSTASRSPQKPPARSPELQPPRSPQMQPRLPD